MPSRKNGGPRPRQSTTEIQMSQLLALQAWAVKRRAEQDERWVELARRMDVVEVKLDQVIATLSEHTRTLNEHTRILAELPDALQKRIGFQPAHQ